MANSEIEMYIPTSRENRRLVHNESKEATSQLIVYETHFKGNHPWPHYDSPLVHSRNASAFSKEFGVFAKDEENFKEYIERQLAGKQGIASAIEFGGPGSNLFADFSDGFFKRTLGVTLVDKRGNKKRTRDELRKHKVIEGDMQSENVFSQILEWTDGEKVDLIFERLGGGALKLPQDPYFMANQLALWYSLLSEEGLMYLQVPHILKPLIKPWKDKVHNLTEAIHITHAQSIVWDDLEIKKFPGAPDKIPLLHPREMMSAYVDNSGDR